ncbi:MAG: hypothetical protein ACQETO_11665 [Pseudomonadota bacterium]
MTGMRLDHSRSFLTLQLPGIGLLLFLFLFGWLALANPIYSWDVVAYTGSVLDWSLRDAARVHEQTYALLRDTVPEAAYGSLVASEYSAAMADNADLFYSQLSQYQVKPLYVALLAGLGLFGLDPVQAGFIVSLGSGLLLCLLCYGWLRHYVSGWVALPVVIALAFGARIFDLSRIVLPDTLSAVMIFAAALLLVERPRHAIPALVLLVASILVRTNNILFVAPLLMMVSWTAWRSRYGTAGAQAFPALVVERLPWWPPLLALLAAVLSWLTISAVHGHDWWRLFHHTFVASIHDLDAFNEPFSMATWLEVVRTRLGQLFIGGFVVYSVLLPFLLLAVCGGLRTRNLDDARSRSLAVMVAIALLNVPLYLLLFPLVDTWDRFFVPFYCLITVFAVRASAR